MFPKRDLEVARRCAEDEPLDERRLMPLDRARELVRKTKVAVSGSQTLVNGSYVTDFDRLWFALLSLENAEEFCEEALRIEWDADPRGKENLAPLERYGEDVLPWLEGSVKDDMTFAEKPWCLLPILQKLLSIEPVSPRAFRLGLRVYAREGFSGPLKPVASTMLVEGTPENWALAVAQCNEEQDGTLLRDQFMEDPVGTRCTLQALAARGLEQLDQTIMNQLITEAAESSKVVEEELDGVSVTSRDPRSMPVTFGQLNFRYSRVDGPSFDNINLFHGGAWATGIVLPESQGEILALQVIGGFFNGATVERELWMFSTVPGRAFASGFDHSSTLIFADFYDEANGSSFGKHFTLQMGHETRELDCSKLPEDIASQLSLEAAARLENPMQAKERAAVMIAQDPELSSKVLLGPLSVMLELGIDEANATAAEVFFDRLQLHELPGSLEVVSRCKSIRQVVQALRERVKLRSIMDGPAPLSFVTQSFV